MKTLHRHAEAFFLCMVLLVVGWAVAGCATKPVTAEDYVQEAKGQVTAAYNTIADLKTSGQITQAQAQTALAKVMPIDDQVHAAEKAMRAGQSVSTSTLAAAIATLQAISAELKKGKP